MKENPGLEELYENFEQLEGLDVEEYEIGPVDDAGDYLGENVYEVSVKMGNERLPEEGSVKVGLTYFENSIGENLNVSFKDLEASNQRNLLTVPFRQFFDQDYSLDLSGYSHRTGDNREFTVRNKTDEWVRHIPWALQNSGLEYEEASNGIRIEGDEEYVVDLTSDKVEVSKEAESQGFMNVRQSLGSVDSLEGFQEVLEEVK